MKILHFSDMHARTNHLDEIKACTAQVLDRAIYHEPDLIAFSGDMFDSSEIRLDSPATKWVFLLFSRLADVAPVLVIIGTPSHDGKCAEVLASIRAKYPIHVVSEAPEQLLLVNGAFLYAGKEAILSEITMLISAFPQPTKKWFQSKENIQVTEAQIADEMTKMFTHFGAVSETYDCPHILVGHWQVSGAFISDTQVLTGVDVEISRDQMDAGNFDLGCLGHIHKAQHIGDKLPGDKRPSGVDYEGNRMDVYWKGKGAYFYAGSTQNNTWGELDKKGFWVYELDDIDKNRARFITTPTRQMVDLKTDCTDPEFQAWAKRFERGGFVSSVWDIVDGLKRTYPWTEDDGTVISLTNARVRLNIKVFVDEVEKLNVPAIKSYFDSIGADLQLEIVRMPRANVRAAKILDQEALFDKLKVNADILEEPIPEGVKEKAEGLDTLAGNRVVDIVKAQTTQIIEGNYDKVSFTQPNSNP